ncbi:phosphoribosylglycinamide formyltransferase [archaeon]
MKVGVLGSTRGTDLAGILGAIDSGELTGIQISVVISNKKNASILELAREKNIPAYFIDVNNLSREDYDKRVHNALAEAGVELVLLIGYMRFLSPWFVNEWQGKCLNVHPSLLPKFAGGMDLNVHQAVLDAGEKETGATIHFVDEGADTGPIAWQESIPVTPEDTADSLKQKVQSLEVKGFIEVLKKARDGNLVSPE